MTIGSDYPAERNKGKSKHVLEENAPLLPSSWEGEQNFNEFNGASFAGAVFNLSTTIVGAGIMSLPAAMKVLGLVPGDVLSGTSSSGIHHSGVLEGWFGEHWWNDRFFVLFVTTLMIAPLACLKHVDSLSYTSALSVALAVIFVVITAGIAIVKLLDGSILIPKLFPSIPNLASVWNLFTAVPILVTAFVCHYNVHSIDNELSDSSQIKHIVRTSLVLCSIVYVVTSFFGYLLFGESTLNDVLANFDADLGIPYSFILSDVVRVSYAAHLMLVFPVIFHALRLNLDGILFPTARPLSTDNRRFTIFSVSLLSLIFLAANFIPSIWDAFQFTGVTAAVCIGYIFPAALTLRDPHGIGTARDKFLSVLMIGLAVLSNAVAIYSDATSLYFKATA